MFQKKDLLGEKFGHFVIIECIGKGKFNEYLWRGVCVKCGVEKIATGVNFKKLKNKNCPEKKEERTGGLIYPKPKRLNYEFEDLEEAGKHREFDCIFYDHCLDHSATMNYINFSCRNCDHLFNQKD